MFISGGVNTHRSLGQDYTAWKQKIKSKNASKLAWEVLQPGDQTASSDP